MKAGVFAVLGLLLLLYFLVFEKCYGVSKIWFGDLGANLIPSHCETINSPIQGEFTETKKSRRHNFSAKIGEVVTFSPQVPDKGKSPLYYDLQIIGEGSECSVVGWDQNSGGKPHNNALKFKATGTGEHIMEVSSNSSPSGTPIGLYKIEVINVQGPGRENRVCWQPNE